MFNDKFVFMWDTQVKPQAIKCAKGYDLILKIENENITDPNHEIVKRLEEMNIQDVNATWYIGRMIGNVEHSLADRRFDLSLLNSVMQVNGTLNSESYWENVWNNNFSSEEAHNLKELGKLTNELQKLM